MSGLTRDDVLGLEDIKDKPPVEVPVPEWDGVMYVRPMSGLERDEFERLHMAADQSGDGIRARLVACCACDANGARLFTAEDVPALARRNANALDRLYDAASRLNLLRRRDVEDAKGKSPPSPG